MVCVTLVPFSQACQGAAPAVQLLLTLPDSPSFLHPLLELCHQAGHITPHIHSISATLLWQQQGQALPAARDLDRHIFGQALGLGGHGLFVKCFGECLQPGRVCCLGGSQQVSQSPQWGGILCPPWLPCLSKVLCHGLTDALFAHPVLHAPACSCSLMGCLCTAGRGLLAPPKPPQPPS